VHRNERGFPRIVSTSGIDTEGQEIDRICLLQKLFSGHLDSAVAQLIIERRMPPASPLLGSLREAIPGKAFAILD
jgi:hypothetical protein